MTTRNTIYYALTTSSTWFNKSYASALVAYPAIGKYNSGANEYILILSGWLNVFDVATQTLTE